MEQAAPRFPVLLTAFGLGRLPLFPGTWGSLLPLVLVVVALQLAAPPAALRCALGGLAIAASWITVKGGRWARTFFGGSDPKEIVSDEVAGQCIALLAAADVITAILSFLAFRLLDITKIWPLRRLERLPGGYGILADDVAAGAVAALAIGLLRLFVLEP